MIDREREIRLPSNIRVVAATIFLQKVPFDQNSLLPFVGKIQSNLNLSICVRKSKDRADFTVTEAGEKKSFAFVTRLFIIAGGK